MADGLPWAPDHPPCSGGIVDDVLQHVHGALPEDALDMSADLACVFEAPAGEVPAGEVPAGEVHLMVDDGDEVPEPAQFEMDEEVINVDAMDPGLRPRLALGCGRCRVVAFNVYTRTYPVKPLDTYSRVLTKTPEWALRRAISGDPDMNTRNGGRSSQAAKEIATLRGQLRAVEIRDARLQATQGAEREKVTKKQKKDKAKTKSLEKRLAGVKAEVDALYSGDPHDPRLSFRGRCLARTLTAEARGLMEREERRTEVNCAGLSPPSTPSALTMAPTSRRARRRCATRSGCGCTCGGLSRRTCPVSATTRTTSRWSA